MRLSELIGTFSLAADTGMGFAAEHGLRSAALAVRLAELKGVDERTTSDAYYLSLLRYAGCTAGSHAVSIVLGDEIDFGKDTPGLDFGRTSEMLRAIVATAFRTRGLFGVTEALKHVPDMPGVSREHCETAVLLGRRIGFDESFLTALNAGFERWDGTGQPTQMRRDGIPLPMRIAHVAFDIDRGFSIGGIEPAQALLKKHSGRELDPDLVELFLANASDFVSVIEAPSAWSEAMDAEPAPVRSADDAQADEVLRAMADFTDMKSSFTRGHSRGVAERAAAGASRLKLGPDIERNVYRAGLVHDIGRIAVNVRVLDKPGALTEEEWERVRLHTYVGERILSKAPCLRDVAEIASLAHERLDGSGYHRKLGQSGTSMAARLIAAADVYQALIEARAHRPARSAEEAADELRRLAVTGELSSEAVEAILGAAGHRERTVAQENLTPREIEVLALVGRGLTNKEIAAALGISVKTAGRHLEHIFEKLGVTTRAGATMAALHRGLIGA